MKEGNGRHAIDVTPHHTTTKKNSYEDNSTFDWEDFNFLYFHIQYMAVQSLTNLLDIMIRGMSEGKETKKQNSGHQHQASRSLL